MMLFVAFPCAAQTNSTLLHPDFEPSSANPVFDRASDDNWGGECGTIFAPQVIEHEGMYSRAGTALTMERP